MRPRIAFTCLSLAVLIACGAAADVLTTRACVLTTRDGRSISGTFRGASEELIRVEVEGVVQTLPLAQVAALSFGEAPPTGTPGAAAMPTPQNPVAPSASQPTAAATPSSVRVLEVPAGTKLRVRLSDSLDPRHAAAGDRFAALLETPLVADGVTIAGANSKVYGKVAQAQTAGLNDSRIQLELIELMLQGQTATIVTGTHKVVDASAEGPASAAAAADSAAGQADRIPSGTSLEFRLLRPFEIQLR